MFNAHVEYMQALLERHVCEHNYECRLTAQKMGSGIKISIGESSLERLRVACSLAMIGSPALHPREMQAGFALCFSSAITGLPTGEMLLNLTTFPLFTIVCGSD